MTKKNDSDMESLFYDEQSFDVKDDYLNWKAAFFTLLGVSVVLLSALTYLLLQCA